MSYQLLWLSDSHLNFLRTDNAALEFGQSLLEENPDANGLIITGDISDGEHIKVQLSQLAEGFQRPIYFVLGNHDIYNSSFKDIENIVTGLTKKFDNLHWLNQGSHTINGISIVGIDGWYDARIGNTRTDVELNDFSLIKDLWGGLNYRDLMIELVRNKADKEAERLDALLFEEICNVDSDEVLIATHVSPYPGSCWHEGGHSNRDWLPWFCSAVTGKVIDKYAENHPKKKFIVIVGHGHSPGIYERMSNLIVYTGRAKYFYPDLSGIINIDNGHIEIKPSCNFPVLIEHINPEKD